MVLAGAMSAALLLSACAAQPGAGLPPDDGTDACRPQAAELDRVGAAFVGSIIAGVGVIGAGGVLGTRPGVIGGIVFLASSAVAATAAATQAGYLDQRRSEHPDAAGLATSVATDLNAENQNLEKAQQAMDQVLNCRLTRAAQIRQQSAAGALPAAQAQELMTQNRQQAERDLQIGQAIQQRIQARSEEFAPAVDAIAPAARTTAQAAARPAPVRARPREPVRLQAAPLAAAAPTPVELPANQPVEVRPARNPGFVAVQTPQGQPLGYAPAAVFTIPASATRAVASPAAAAAATSAPDRMRVLASTNIARRDNFNAAVTDLQRAVSSGGFELGT